MITKINNFFHFLEELKTKFQNLVRDTTDNNDVHLNVVESLCFNNKDLFPLDLESIFDQLFLDYQGKAKTFVWDKLKNSYFNYEEFIEMDFKYFKSSHNDFSDTNQKLFNHSKKLSANYFFFISRFYYWHFGRHETRKESIIHVHFLNHYKQNYLEFEGLDNDKSLIKLIDYYDFQYEQIEREIRYKYTTNSILLEISEPEYFSENSINPELEKLNKQYLTKLELLKDYKDNITKLSMNLKFEFPKFLSVANLNTKVRFVNPEEIFNSLQPFLAMPEFELPLKKLLDGSISKSNEGINLNLNSKEIGTIFKYLSDTNQIVKGTQKTDISIWIVDNFQYKKASKYVPVKSEGIKKVLFNNTTIEKKDLPKDYQLILNDLE